MLNLVRFALQCLIALLLLISVIGFFGQTGNAEKLVLVAFVGALIYAATQVRRIGARPEASTQ